MSEKARVLLIGSGGIGTIAALNLERGSLAQVSCVLRSNYATVVEKGFEIISCEHGHVKNWRPTEILNTVPHVRGETRFDFIVCCTKNVPDVGPSLCEIIAPAVTVGYTVIVLIQNGLNIEKPFFSRFPENIILSGVSRIDAHEVSPGVIEQKQKDNLRVGAFHSPRHNVEDEILAAKHFVAIYGAGRKTTCLLECNVAHDRWKKLVYNATLNPICALTGVNTGDLRLTEGAMNNLIVPAMEEVVQVSEAKGYPFSKSIVNDTIRSNPAEEKISPSMQKDVEKGNFIEHENILGEVIREAQAMGIATPILSTLYTMCSIVQWKLKNAKGLA